jgi:hypothetical protein
MRRILTAVAVAAACSFAALPAAQATTPAPAVKAPKAKSYAHCETFWGCGSVPFLIYRKTKTWEYEGYAGTEYAGTYEKVGKYLVFHYSLGYDCETIVKRVKDHYVGHNAAGCGMETIELRPN